MTTANTPLFHIARLAALLLGGWLAVACGAPSEPPRQVILITIDTLRADHLSLYDYPRPTTPFLAELGVKGVVFEHAFASCSHTGPSHASLFTSLQPAQHRLLENGQPLNPSLLTLAQAFRDAGYRTGGFTTVQFLKELRLGFDDFHHEERYHNAEHILGQALDWLRAQPADTPQFLWIHLFDVHQWIDERHYEPGMAEEITAAGPDRETFRAYLQDEHGKSFDHPLIGPKILPAIDLYDGQLLYTDRALRAFRDTLHAENLLAENALWVITSDHGEGLGNHDFMGHGKSVYDEQIHIPLIVHAEDGRYGAHRVSELAELVDLAPTLTEIVGASMEAQVVPPDGHSLLPLLRNPAARGTRRSTFAQRRPADEKRLREGWLPGDVFALRTERYKVIAQTEDAPEIFDLEADRFELQNLYVADDPTAAPERTRALLEQLERRWAEMLDQGEHIDSGEINPEYIEELKALGYL